jgi:hypothetical protein
MKLMKKISTLALGFSLLALLASSPSQAARRGYSSPSTGTPGVGVPVSGSIAMPSSATATYTNPAGLIGNDGARLSLQGGSEKPMDNPTYRALILAGNGMFGASVGVKYNIQDGAGDDTGYAVYGLALNISAIDLTLGFSGRNGIKSATGSDYNAGLLFKPTSLVTIGATAMGLQNQIDSIGLGVGFELMSGLDLVGDAAFNSKFKNGEFKPGLRLSNNYAGLSLSYGTGATVQFAKDFSTAAYLKLSSNSELEFEYNHGGDLPKYFAALSLGF